MYFGILMMLAISYLFAWTFIIPLFLGDRQFENLVREPERLRSEHLPPGLVSHAGNLARNAESLRTPRALDSVTAL
jgi:hypothetical protein